jgi:hypothetical protein
MNPPPAALGKDVIRAREEIRSPEPASARRRERLLQRVLAARNRLPQNPRGTLARSR